MTGKFVFVNSAQLSLVSWVCIAMLLTGCSTTELPKYQAQPFDTYAFSQNHNGLAIAIHPLTSRKESEKYFGKDLLSANILAGFLIAENRSTTSTFLLSNEKIQLQGLKAGEPPAHIGNITTLEVSTAIVSAGALLITPLAIVLLPITGAMVSAGIEVEHNYLAKELQTETLAPGEKTDGFVYFHLPVKKADWPERWTLHVESIDVKQKAPLSLDIPFAWSTE